MRYCFAFSLGAQLYKINDEKKYTLFFKGHSIGVQLYKINDENKYTLFFKRAFSDILEEVATKRSFLYHIFLSLKFKIACWLSEVTCVPDIEPE